MKLVESWLRKDIKPVILYINDLRTVFAFFIQFPPPYSISINGDDYEISGADDLQHLEKPELNDLTIRISHNYFIQFFKDHTVIHFNDTTDKSKALFYDVSKFIEGKQRRFRFLKARIKLFEKPKKINVFLQEKNPVWLTIIISLASAFLPILAQILARNFGWIP